MDTALIVFGRQATVADLPRALKTPYHRESGRFSPMLRKVTEILQDSTLYPAGLDQFFEISPPKLWCIGEPQILKRELLGIISSRKIAPELALTTAKILRQLVPLEVTFISGWHSFLEKEALNVLLTQQARVIICLAKSLDKFNPSPEISMLIDQGRALLLTHCSPKARRISREASLRRNLLVAGAAKVVLSLSAPEGSASFGLSRLALNLGRAVFTPVHHINESLLACGSLPATRENIQRVLQR
ncbi:MAG: DNA-processing protein DprA [Candidatus Binatia bacterium]